MATQTNMTGSWFDANQPPTSAQIPQKPGGAIGALITDDQWRQANQPPTSTGIMSHPAPPPNGGFLEQARNAPPYDPNAPRSPEATDQGPEGWGWGTGGHDYWVQTHPGVPEQYPNGPPTSSGQPVDTARLPGQQAAGGPPTGGNPTDPAYVRQAVDYLASLPGADPTLKTTPDYWVGKILETGGWTNQTAKGEDNVTYWTGRSKQGAGDAGGSGGGFGTFNGLSTADFQNSPGYQFARDQGLQGIERSAAAKGTLLTGGTLKRLAQYGTGLADQTYGDAFQRALNTLKTQYDDLYNLANLGLDASKSTTA